jgi:hypothetical protein
MHQPINKNQGHERCTYLIGFLEIQVKMKLNSLSRNREGKGNEGIGLVGIGNSCLPPFWYFSSPNVVGKATLYSFLERERADASPIPLWVLNYLYLHVGRVERRWYRRQNFHFEEFFLVKSTF